MIKCYICLRSIEKRAIVLEVSQGKDIRICEDCMGEFFLMKIAKGKRNNHNLEELVNELKEMATLRQNQL